MTCFLLDTNALIWSIFDSDRMGNRQRETLRIGDVFISHVTVFEIAIKLNAGRLPLPEIFSIDFEAAIRHAASDLDARVLPLEFEDFARLSRLPIVHRDPFDRLIISQALNRGMTVVTGDRAFKAYAGLDALEI